MHTYHSHSFQSESEFCYDCLLERLCGVAQSRLSSYARSLFCIVGRTASSAGSLGDRLGSRSALSRPTLRLR